MTERNPQMSLHLFSILGGRFLSQVSFPGSESNRL